jgi:hypothetical protein
VAGKAMEPPKGAEWPRSGQNRVPGGGKPHPVLDTDRRMDNDSKEGEPAFGP